MFVLRIYFNKIKQIHRHRLGIYYWVIEYFATPVRYLSMPLVNFKEVIF